MAIAVAFTSVFVELPMAQTSPQIVAYKVTGTPNLGNPGSEQFWSNIPWTNLSLTANLAGVPTSGLTPYVLVKAAWNGTDVIVLEKFPVKEPAVKVWSTAAAGLDPAASGPGLFRIIELTPGVTYTVEKNYTNYVSIINGQKVQGRIVFNYSGIALLPALNNTQIQVTQNGTILLYHSLRGMEYLLDQDSMFYGYYVNSTWYYPDRAAIMWYMGAETNPADCMNIGGKFPGQVFDGVTIPKSGGSLSSGPASIWMWTSGATWNSSQDPAFASNLWLNTSLTGLSYKDQGNHGFAVPLYTNQTNIYEVDTAGIWYAPVQGSGLNGSLYYIWTGANYSGGYWTVEYVRPLTVPADLSQYMPNITPGHVYDVAFAVWQGKEGETLFDKSITSSFVTLEVSNSTAPTTSTTISTSPSPATSSTSPSTSTPMNGSSSALPSSSVSSSSGIASDVVIIGVVIGIVVLAILYVVYRR